MQETNKRKSEQEWEALLSPEEFRVARLGATERPYQGRYHDHDEPGTYLCVCCGSALFSSDCKYESGSGWPSWWAPIDERRIARRADHSHAMQRVELLCAACDAHLGHVFDDGPEPTGLRYCINSVSLRFEPEPTPTGFSSA